MPFGNCPFVDPLGVRKPYGSLTRLARLRSLLLMVALAAVTAGCGDLVCTLEPQPAIQADIRDSVTGAGAAFHASLVVTNATVYDSSFFVGVSSLPFDTASFSTVASASNGEPGTYTVRVRRAGSRTWERTSVRVGGNRCGADATRLLVRLQPTP